MGLKAPRPAYVADAAFRQRTLTYIREYMAENDGLAPSTLDLMRGLGVKSTSTVHRLLAVLRDEGAITMTPGRTRAIRLHGEAPPAPVAIRVVTPTIPEGRSMSFTGVSELLDLIVLVGAGELAVGPDGPRLTIGRV